MSGEKGMCNSSHLRSARSFNLLAPRVQHHLLENFVVALSLPDVYSLYVKVSEARSGRIIRGFADIRTIYTFSMLSAWVSRSNDGRKSYFKHLTTAAIFEQRHSFVTVVLRL